MGKFSMKTISVIDTSISSYNLGNQIIMESVFEIIDELFPDDFLFNLPWEGAISKATHRYLRNSDYVFFGGTNSLSSHMLKYKQMSFRLRDLFRFNDLTLLGMGWWQYQNKPDVYTSMFIRRLLSKKNIHSVRDGYTKKMLNSIGVSAVIYTCCPSTWKLTASHCSFIPTKKAKNVIVTFTDYNKSRKTDECLFDVLLDSYDKIYYWVQGVGDLDYIETFHKHKGRITHIPPSLKKFDSLLETEDCDYIGTRLHAGIRAIQKKKRALILAIDNRAAEISEDISLNVKPRGDISAIQGFISGHYETRLKIPFDEINLWKAQFQ